jgi:peptide/nickel transport system substrate-binding protein
MLTSGAVDYIGTVLRDKIPGLKKNKNVNVNISKSWYNFMAFFNCRRAPLSKVSVRRALSYAIPYKNLIKVGVAGYGTQSRGPVPVGLWPNAKGNLKQYTYDLKKAEQLLNAAGYPKGHKFNLTLTWSAENDVEKLFVPLIKESFAKIGVNVTVTGMLWNQQWAKIKGPIADRQDITVVTWWPSLPDGYDNLGTLFKTEKKAAWNMSYYYNKSYDTLLDKAYALSGTNLKASQAAYTTCMQRLVNQAPAAYLFDEQTVTAALKNIKLGKGAANPNYTDCLFWKDVTK